jgi:ribosomal-protein-alanine N-acetyltransferase
MIGPVGADCADGLARLHASAFDRPWDAASMGVLMASPGVFALTDAAEQGFILIRVTVDEAEILTLAVSPNARRRGLGRDLVQAAVNEAERRGAESLFLEVAADNTAALALYQRTGFRPAGRRTGYYARTEGVAVDALVLKKPLPSSA